MATGQVFANISDKRILGLQDLRENFLSFLRSSIFSNFARMYETDGVYTALLGLSAAGNDHFQITGASKATDGVGHIFDPAQSSFLASVQFENANTIPYFVGLTYAEVPSGIQRNPSSGQPEYVSTREEIGVSGTPDAVVDNGNGTITFTVTSVTESGVTNAGRSVRVYRVVPAKDATSASIAIETCTVAFTGGLNKITTTGKLGQSTVSTVAADYVVVLMGPEVKRNTDLTNVAGVFFVGTVTGAGAGSPPVTFNTTAQFLFSTTLANISNITRVDSHGFLKVDVHADSSDVNESQLRVRNFGGSTVFDVSEKGVSSNLNPAIDGTQSLGTAGLRWNLIGGRLMRLFDASDPRVEISETAAGADLKNWRIEATGGQFLLQTDTDATGAAQLIAKVTRAGASPSNLIVAPTLIPFTDGATDLGNNSDPQRWRDLHLSRKLNIEGTTPVARLKDTSTGVANQGTWHVVVSDDTGSGTLKIQIANDAENTLHTALAIFRAGNTLSNITAFTAVLPDTNNTKDLGSTGQQWRDVFVASALHWSGGQYAFSHTSAPLTSVGANSPTDVPFNTDDEVFGISRPTTAKFTVNRAGAYLIHAQAEFTNQRIDFATQALLIKVRKNNTTDVPGSTVTTEAGATGTGTPSSVGAITPIGLVTTFCIVTLAASDFITLQATTIDASGHPATFNARFAIMELPHRA